MGVSTLGKPIPQVNALAKVLGRSKYAGDIHLPGMLHGKVLRSPYAHARIVQRHHKLVSESNVVRP